MSLANIIYNKSQKYRDLIAISCQGKNITYYDLNKSSLELASLITHYGYYKETVAILGKKKIPSYIAILGTLYAGCNYTPLNDSYNISKTKKILEITNAKVIIGETSSIEKLKEKGVDLSNFKVFLMKI